MNGRQHHRALSLAPKLDDELHLPVVTSMTFEMTRLCARLALLRPLLGMER
jgi:hypothetical protein